MNVLDKVPKSVQGRMKVDLREISAAPTRPAAGKAIAVFIEKYGAKYPKAVDCLAKDRDALLAFFDLSAEPWDHLRTTKLNDVDPQAWLADVLGRIASHPAQRLAELLPWNWKPVPAAAADLDAAA